MQDVLDMKMGDVNGDGIPDIVYLVGHKSGVASEAYADRIELLIQDGLTRRITRVQLRNNAGYNASLFLGDFSKDGVADILVRIQTGGSGGYLIGYMYSFKHNRFTEMFDSDAYNQDHKFNVDFENMYKVGIASPRLDVLFTIDISNKGYDYVSQYYDDNGKLKRTVQGEILALGGLFPIVAGERGTYFDLLAYQRIIGTTNADTLGYVTNQLTWTGTRFESIRLAVSVPGTKLITPYAATYQRAAWV